MNTDAVPFAVQLSAIFVFALSVLMVAVHSILFAQASERASLPRAIHTIAPFVCSGFLALWLGLAFSMTAADGLRGVTLNERLALSLLVGFGPVISAVALLFLSKTVSAVYMAMPSEWLIRAQIYRVAGLMFLYPFLSLGMIPAEFAIPAAVGDFLTGLFAPLVASAVAKGKPHAFTWAVAWNAFGILDLIVAPVMAI